MNLRMYVIAWSMISIACTIKPQKSCNFIQDDQLQRVSWKGNLPINIWIHESVPSEYYSAITRAMASWELAAGRSLFKISGTRVGPVNTQKDNENVIYWLNPWLSGNLSEEAYARIYWTYATAYEADIFVNASFTVNQRIFNFSVSDPAPNQVDFESLMVHELGHVLGLAHNNADKSVMNEYLSSGVKRRDILEPDINSIKCEY